MLTTRVLSSGWTWCVHKLPSRRQGESGSYVMASCRSPLGASSVAPPRNARHVRRNERGTLNAEPPRLHAAGRWERRLDGRQRVPREVAVVREPSLQRLQCPLAQPQQRLPALRSNRRRWRRRRRR